MLYYPGWIGYVDGDKQILAPMEKTGYLMIDVPEGHHSIMLKYEGTVFQQIGTLVSIVTLSFLFAISILRRKDKMPETLYRSVYLTTRWWLPLGLVILAIMKLTYLDPYTTLFRSSSTCDSVQSAEIQADIRFGASIRLCGYRILQRTLHPGDLIKVEFYWQMNKDSNDSANTFVHLLGTTFNPETGNLLWGQQDKENPGEHSTNVWKPDLIYRDIYRFRISEHTPPGDYQLEIGWRDSEGKRIPPNIFRENKLIHVSDLDSILLSEISVK